MICSASFFIFHVLYYKFHITDIRTEMAFFSESQFDRKGFRTEIEAIDVHRSGFKGLWKNADDRFKGLWKTASCPVHKIPLWKLHINKTIELAKA